MSSKETGEKETRTTCELGAHSVSSEQKRKYLFSLELLPIIILSLIQASLLPLRPPSIPEKGNLEDGREMMLQRLQIPFLQPYEIWPSGGKIK